MKVEQTEGCYKPLNLNSSTSLSSPSKVSNKMPSDGIINSSSYSPSSPNISLPTLANQSGKQSVNIEDTNAETPADDHYEPSVRLLQIPKSTNGACGFHLTRSKWDPYPWVGVVLNKTLELPA